MAKAPSKSTSQTRTPAKARRAPAARKAAPRTATKPKTVAKTRTVKAKPAAKTVAHKTVAPKKTAQKTATVKTAAKRTTVSKTAKKASLKTKIATPKTTKIKTATSKTAKLKTVQAKTVKAKTAKTNTTSPKAVKAKAKAAPRPSIPKAARVTLQSQVNTLAKRLAAADTLTRKHAKSLEADFSALATQMGRTKAGHTRLTRRVTELSKTLQKDMSAMQSEVARDLSAALANPTLDSLQSALTAADIRLSESETAQNAAIARINHHISDIATIVEARLSDEAKARQEAMAEMKASIESGHAQLKAAQAALQDEHSRNAQAMKLRFSELQSESAEAIRVIGDKVVDVADEMGRRRETMASRIRQELNESTLAASAEFEQFRRVVERRLESLESEFSGLESNIDRAVAPLTSRVEGLEYGLTAAPAPAVDNTAPSFPPVPSMTGEAAANPYAGAKAATAAAPLMDDAFSPAPQPSTAPLAPPQTQTPDINPEPLELEPLEAKAGPVPYDPMNYQAYQQPQPQQPFVPAQSAPNLAPAAAITPVDQNAYQSAAETLPYPPQTEAVYPNAAAQALSAQPTPPQQTPPMATAATAPPPIMDSELPYADPAYAETAYADTMSAVNEPAQSMSDARPGAFEKLKRIGSKTRGANDSGAAQLGASTILTPRNLRVGGMVAALGLASFIGVQTLVKDKDGADPAPKTAASQTERPTLAANGGQILGANSNAAPNAGLSITEETIGQYADNRQAELTQSGATELETAALAGNTVAQLQFGLSKLESGDIEDGVELIRAAANKDQPAALYRLAKLYETGQGVGQDAQTARQLTERAARGGNRIAMHDLALYYAEGRGGIDIDIPTAAKWFEKAADRGVVDSQFNLGVLFESGQGLPQDMEAALVWYSIAGAQGDQMAAGRVGVLRKTLSEEQLSRADTRIAAYSPARIDEEANGIFNNVPWAKPAKNAAAANSAKAASIRQTQNLLNELGYEVGAADGAAGPKTRAAIKSFERSNGLAETGVVSSELIERLEFAAGA